MPKEYRQMTTFTKWIAGPVIAIGLMTFGNSDTASAQGIGVNVGGYGWGVGVSNGFNRGYGGYQSGYRSTYVAPTFRTYQSYRVYPGYNSYYRSYHPPYPSYGYGPTQVYRYAVPSPYNCGRRGPYGF